MIAQRTEGPAVQQEYTIEELSRQVGMSARNIRAHQARRILAPPVRRGRTVIYQEHHLRRLETILSLQRQGFNLTSIEAMLGVRGTLSPGDGLAPLMQRLAVESPALVDALTRHGVVAWKENGAVQMVRPRALRAALELHRSGLPARHTMQVLVEVLDRIGRPVDELLRSTGDRILSLPGDPARPRAATWDEWSDSAELLAQGLIDLISEAFRVVAENRGPTSVVDIVGRRSGQATVMLVETAAAIDLG
ncbi:MerR family transcriptional regulator [Actinoplanes sp. NEAU-A12]|uniref:MerR family transcriptional regulator n=1 Tax=Actinoplanes sandaracinus TaxID=3045177 RepID=A0ABT6WXU5_9ACTN|nr:MerR family transcriptional regulator [Actinoplanes sandaracinus]MDI6104567.1 MerR family transcriptional regulator [Actinoplanes sandaracinus]